MNKEKLEEIKKRALNPEKTCQTCNYRRKHHQEHPCNECKYQNRWEK